MPETSKSKQKVSNKPKKTTLSFQQPSEVDLEKRRFLTNATTATGAAGVAVASVPFVGSMLPSERAEAAGAPVEVDVSDIPVGSVRVTEWRGKPVWVIHRTDEMTAGLANMKDELADPECNVESQQPAYCRNTDRSIRSNIGVMVGICTHLGCAPTAKLEPGGDMGKAWKGGFFCPCHGSKFDLAGRVFKGSPAPTNLVVPPHTYLDEDTLLIGVDTVDTKAEA